MKSTFSDNLIQKCQRVIRQKTGRKISTEQAELALSEFARIGFSAIKTFDLPNNKLIKNQCEKTKREK